MTILKLLRKNLLNLVPYQSARKLGGQGTIWLNANENPLSPHFHLKSESFNRYPEPQPQKVLEYYADYSEVKPENILITRGGDEGIELIIRAFCEPNQDAVLFCPPTYGMYAVSAETHGVKLITINQTANFQLDLKRIHYALENSSAIKVLFICNPNNPTGTLLNHSDILTLLEMTRHRAIVVIDEAYIEFSSSKSYVLELQNNPHLAIIRTLSKAFGLAGLRCGFVLANPELIRILNKVIAPYPIPIPVADIAEQALLPQGIDKMRERVEDILENRSWLICELKKISMIIEIFDTAANYVLVKFKDGQKVFNSLWEQGIILRDQNKVSGLANCIRITVGTAEENRRVIEAIRNIE